MSTPFSRTSFFVLLLGLALASHAAHSQETVVRNDSLEDFSQGFIQVGFAADESAAAWLTSPCNGDLTRVQILWRSQAGGTGDTLGDSITVFEDGAFPVPGATRTTLVGPVLTDGFLNEFTLPSPLPVAPNEVFVVSFKFLDDPPGTGPSVVTDADGCQTPKNSLFAIPPSSWFDSCAIGVSGDFVIRGVVDCGAMLVPLTFHPASGDAVRTARWDLSIIAEVPSGVSTTNISGTLNGVDVSAFLASCLKEGFFQGSGLSLRCSGFSSQLPLGVNTLAVTLDFSDGSSASDSASWTVLRNFEP